MAELTMGTIYDANKSIMNLRIEGTDEYKFKALNHLEMAGAQKKLEDFFNWECDSYAMLYCKERSDITIFHMYENQNLNPPALAAAECIGCCTDRGDIISIEEQPDGNYEIWLRINNEVFAYYLFPYDNAVIEV